MTGSGALAARRARRRQGAAARRVRPLTLGSDHQVYSDSSFGIPAIYLNDWPDRYIHTNFDVPANIDPTKLAPRRLHRRRERLGAGQSRDDDAPALLELMERQALRRAAGTLERRHALTPGEATITSRFALAYEQATVDSLDRFLGTADGTRKSAAFLERLRAILGDPSQLRLPPSREGLMVYRRNPAIKGPVSVFGYDYLDDHFGKDRAAGLKLPARDAGHGAHYAYDALNLSTAALCGGDPRRAIGHLRAGAVRRGDRVPAGLGGSRARRPDGRHRILSATQGAGSGHTARP